MILLALIMVTTTSVQSLNSTSVVPSQTPVAAAMANAAATTTNVPASPTIVVAVTPTAAATTGAPGAATTTLQPSPLLSVQPTGAGAAATQSVAVPTSNASSSVTANSPISPSSGNF